MSKDGRFVEKWGKEREKGKERYVFTNSIRMGLAIMVGMTAGRWIRGGGLFFDPLYFIGGFIGAMISVSYKWRKSEKKYKDLVSSNE